MYAIAKTKFVRVGLALLVLCSPACALVGYQETDGSGDAPPALEGRMSAEAGASDGGKSKPASQDGAVAGPDADASNAAVVRTSDGGQHVSCAENAICFPDCTASECDVSCASSNICRTDCAKDTHCSIDCRDTINCDMVCKAGARCDVDCTNSEDCDFLECAKGASCTLQCANNPLGCSLVCHGVAMSCEGGLEVCDAPCP